MSPGSPLLTTKLFLPPARLNLVPRQRLTTRLNQSHPVVLIAAPAGFGKTTLLSEWIPTSPHCVTWLSLDDGDNDPGRFWLYIIAALQRLHTTLGASAQVLLHSLPSTSLTAVLTTLLNEIADFPNDFALVLDDYHVITHQPIHEALTFLLDHRPPNMRMVIATRADPPLPLARLRARGQLAELRAGDLRFTADEAAAFLNDYMRLNLAAADVAALEARTEGWIAGLQLAALSMQGRDDARGFIQAFSGSHRHVLNYLAEEVLSRRPSGTLDFLLQTSILERLSGSLCEAVTGQVGGQATLEALAQANLFIVPLDDEGRWYRYHHLFAEVLRARFTLAQPAAAPELHRRASAWYARNGWLAEAVNHALAARDLDRAASLIEQAAEDMLNRGEYAAVQGWLQALPEPLVRSRPQLCLFLAAASVAGFQLEAAEAWLLAAEQSADREPAARASIASRIAFHRGTIALLRQDAPVGIDLTRQALSGLPADRPLLRGRMLMQLGTAYLGRGKLSDGQQTLSEAFRLSESVSDLGTAVVALNGQGVAHYMQGALRQAATTFQQALELARRRGVSKMPFVGLIHIHLAEVLYEWNDLPAIASHLHEAIEQGQRSANVRVLLDAYQIQVRYHWAQGDLPSSLEALHKAQALVADYGLPPEAARGIQALQLRLWLAAGQLGEANAWAQAGGRGLMASVELADEPLQMALAHVFLAQHDDKQALSLLTRLRDTAESRGQYNSLIAALALQAVAHAASGNVALALASLERALARAEPEGYVRIFVDEGEPLRALLAGLKLEGRSPARDAYVSQLLAELGGPDALVKRESASADQGQSEPEPLRERELEILRLIASGRSNHEIAAQLVLGLSTVKTHINNLFRKLDVTSRTQAVARARALGLLDD